MSLVFACIAPHSGHLMLGKQEPTPIPKSRAAMTRMHQELAAARPETLALITPHGVYIEDAMSMGVSPTAAGEQDGVRIEVATDLDLAATWAYRAMEMGVPVTPVATPEGVPLPLDWGATIPLALLDPPPATYPVAVVCPSRSITRAQLVYFGEALVVAAEEMGKRVALIVSADQGHGHASDGPYDFAPESAEFDKAMTEAVAEDRLTDLLSWDEDWIDAAMPDSYWHTLCLIGVQKRVKLRPTLLSYEVDHYFGLLCATYNLVS